MRNVAPQRVLKENVPAVSQLVPATADFKALTSDHPEGVVTRFMQDRLEIVFWLKPPAAAGMIFGCLLSVDALTDLWRDALPENASPDYVLALLNDKGRPVVTQPPGEKGRDWRRPFVASEIGEALPHWEAALYLMRPQQLRENARSVRRTLLLLIAAALAAIVFGGWAVFADARRQLALAQKKTDFVSNVSHELKTPLTSIRMFAEMMQSGSATEEKRPQYLRIIVAEAERLTRLINNVLDFARLERKQKALRFSSARFARSPGPNVGRPRTAFARARIHHPLAGGPAALSGARERRCARADFREPPVERREVQHRPERGRDPQLPHRRFGPCQRPRPRLRGASGRRGENLRGVLSRARFARERDSGLRARAHARATTGEGTRRRDYLSGARRRREQCDFAAAVRRRTGVSELGATNKGIVRNEEEAAGSRR